METIRITKKEFDAKVREEMSAATKTTYADGSTDLSYPSKEVAEQIALSFIIGIKHSNCFIFISAEDVASFWKGHLSISRGEKIFVKYGKNMVCD